MTKPAVITGDAPVVPSYTVLSDNFAAKKSGEIVTQDGLEGCNIAALVESGHLARVIAASAENKEKQ